jgi:hypothetical protein
MSAGINAIVVKKDRFFCNLKKILPRSEKTGNFVLQNGTG